MSTEELDRVKNVIEATLHERFKDVVFDPVEVIPQFDDEGEMYLIVNAVYADDGSPPDVSLRLSFPRHVLPRMEKAGTTAFPVMHYIAKSEF